MGKAILHLCGICFIVITIVGLLQDYGWAVVLWPLSILAAGAVLLLLYTAVYGLLTAPQRRALRVRAAVGRLEAELGVPVPTDGVCRACGKPLVAGAKFCAYCRTPTARVAVICPTCKTRNPEDATYCAECGADLHPLQDAPKHAIPSAQVSSVSARATAAPSRDTADSWTCSYCLARNHAGEAAGVGQAAFICPHCGKPDPARAPRLARQYQRRYERARHGKA